MCRVVIALPLLLPLELMPPEAKSEDDSPSLTGPLVPGAVTTLQTRGRPVARINWRSRAGVRHIANGNFFMGIVPPAQGTHSYSREF